jgi:hypothetical protein
LIYEIVRHIFISMSRSAAVPELLSLGDITHHETALYSSSCAGRSSDGCDDILHANCSLGYFRVCRIVSTHCLHIWLGSVFDAEAEGTTLRLSLRFYVA